MNNRQVDRINNISIQLIKLTESDDGYFDVGTLQECINELEKIAAEASERTQDQRDAKDCLEHAVEALKSVTTNKAEDLDRCDFSDMLHRATLVSHDFYGL